MLPVRKKRPIRIETKYWFMDILVIQATLYESIRFRSILEQDRISERWNDFIDQNSKITLKWWYKFMPWMKNKVKKSVLLTQKTLIQEVYDLRDLSYKSVYLWVEMGWDGRKSLEWSELVDICGWDILSAVRIQQECTREQYDWMLDRIIFKNLEKDDKGRAINDSMLMTKNKWLTKEESDLRDLIKKQRSEWMFENKEWAKFIIEN